MKILEEQIQELEAEYAITGKEGFTKAILSLIKSIVPEEEPIFETNLAKYLPWNKHRATYFIEGYNQCRQQIINKIEGKI